MAKYSISIVELLRTPSTNHSRVAAMLGGLSEDTAERKVVSVLFLSLGTAARKSVADRFPEMQVATENLPALLNNCRAAFQKEKNMTLNRFTFLARKLERLDGIGSESKFQRSDRNPRNGRFHP